MGNLFQEQFFHQKSDDHLNSRQQVYLMCPPDHYGISYEINPWMDRMNQPDLDLAREQWYNLVSDIQEAGAVVDIRCGSSKLGTRLIGFGAETTRYWSFLWERRKVWRAVMLLHFVDAWSQVMDFALPSLLTKRWLAWCRNRYFRSSLSILVSTI